MKNKKNLMFRLTLVSFVLNIVSIFLSVHTHEKTADTEKTASQKYKALIDPEKFIKARDPLVKGFDSFPRNMLT